jgi:hypothetical protein
MPGVESRRITWRRRTRGRSTVRSRRHRDVRAGDTLRVVQLGKDFRDLLELSNRHQVRYLIVGGFAVAVHGSPRYTKDLDIWLDVSPDNAARMVGYEPNRVDFLTKLSGVEFAAVYPSRVSTSIGEIDVPVIDRASLIANKRALGRSHDLDDAKDLDR